MSFPNDQHDCNFATDPRINPELRKVLAGQVAVAVGVGRGIGRTCAEFLVRAGVEVIICLALEEHEAVQTVLSCQGINPNVKAEALGVDVKNYEAIQTIIDRVGTQYGHIDILFMNAGRPGQWLPIAESDVTVWWDTLTVSLGGAYNCSRAVLAIMQKQKSGRIIFTSSSAAHYNAGVSSYGISKLGQVRLAEILHVENYKPYNIKCFSYHPGCVRTRFFTDFEDRATGKLLKDDGYASKPGDLESKSAETAYEALKGRIFDTPEMAAGLVTVLAAGKLDFMSGRYLDAGVDIKHYMKHEDEILKQDLCRVRLNQGSGELIPTMNF